jgi:hypothetical protein
VIKTLPIRAQVCVRERISRGVYVARVRDGGNPGAGVAGRTPDAFVIGDLDLVLCAAEIYAEQSPQTCALSAVDQNFLHII